MLSSPQLARVDSERDLSQHIVHCDLDMFYAAVELKRDPTLKGKAFGVGKGVLVTASYEARAFGVRSGMAAHIAYALCPHLITVPNNMQSYVEASQQIMAIFKRFDENLAQASLDEAYLNITDYCRINQVEVSDAVSELRRQVRDETGLTVSVGVAPNKMLAKIGSDKNKPDGQFLLEPTRQASIDFMHNLPIRKVPGVGRVTERMLQALGVETCGDIWKLRVRIALVLGDASLEWLLRYNLGIASSVVEPGKREERKSVGREHTFKPTSDIPTLFELLRASADQVEKDLKKLDFVGKKVTLICKYDNFQRFTRDQTQQTYVQSADEIYRVVKGLLDLELKVQPGLTLRLIGARVGTLKDIRKPQDGGPLKRFWSQPQQSNKRRCVGGGGLDHGQDALNGIDVPSGQGQGADAAGDDDLEEDEEAKALRQALAASLEDYKQSQAAARDDEQSGNVALSEPSASNTSPPTEDWDLSPPAERSARDFASALWRSTPEAGRRSPVKRSMSEHRASNEECLREMLEDEPPSVSHTSATPSEPTAASTAPPSLPPLICPVCSQTVPTRFGSTLAGRNAQLNKHIDECLKQGGTSGVDASPTEPKGSLKKSDPRSSSSSGAKTKKPGSLDRFFKGQR